MNAEQAAELRLVRALAAHRPPADLVPLAFAEPFLLASGLQKAIRRGLAPAALVCARDLLHVDPVRLWRRLSVIAMEDIGIPGADAVAEVLWVAGKKAWRQRHGGDWHVVSYLVERL